MKPPELSRRRLIGASAGLALPAALLACGESEAPAAPPPRGTPPGRAVGIDVTAAPFSARGDGKTDDTAAIQRAIDQAQQTRGTVYFPAVGAAFYRVTKPLRITGPVRLVGESMFGVTLCATGLRARDFLIDIDGRKAPNLEWVEIEGMTLMSDNRAPSLVRLDRAANCAFRDLGLRDARHGMLITSDRCYTNLFERVIHVTGLSGSTIRFEAFTGGGQFTFTGCSFGGETGVSLTADSAMASMAFFSCNFERCETNAFASEGTLRGLLFSGCRAEKCAGTYTIDINPTRANIAYGVEISGCFFETDAERAAISFGGNGGPVRGFSIRGNYAEGYTESFVRLNGDGESGAINGNFVDGNVPRVVNALRPNVEARTNEHARR